MEQNPSKHVLLLLSTWPLVREMYFQSYSHQESLQNVPIPISVWYWTNSEFPRSSCSCVLPNSLYNLVQDEWLLSLTKTWTIPISIHWSLVLQLKMLSDPLWFSTSFANVGKPSSSIDDLRSSYYETPPLFTFRTSFLTPVELEDSSLSSCFQKSACWVFSCRLTWEFVGWISAWVPHQFPDAREHRLVLFRQSLDRRDCSNLEEGSSSHSTGCATPDSWVWTSPSPNALALVLPPVNLHWKSLLVLSLTWHSVSWSDRENYCNGCKRTSRNSWCWTNEEDDSTRHAWSSLWPTYERVGFWCQQIWFELLVPNWFCRTTNQAQPCGFWTRVSLLDFVLWWSSWSHSLSSKMYNWEECVFVGTWSTCDSWSTSRLLLFIWCSGLGFSARMVGCPAQFPVASLIGLLVLFVECNTSITTSQRSRANSTSIRSPASNEMISDSVELWATDVCFLHIQQMGTSVRLPKILTPRLISNPQSRQQSLSLGINPVDNAEPCCPHDNIVGSHLCDECMKSILPNVCRKTDSILWLLLQVCWQTIKSLVFQFLPSTSMSRQFVSILFDNSPTDSSSSFLNWWTSKQGLETVKNCSTFLFASSQYLSTHFRACPYML